eukprot:TRINITY_DN12437_c0_g1_i13.p1 TRINITY_DN12437_c0_g1~~TRINITY_DN12437_c0_g1_i13.p1  ORF type:complete len:224 (+),score=26.15 TRINITY_DN12437_c0_g1_i13:574-1245(+)
MGGLKNISAGSELFMSILAHEFLLSAELASGSYTQVASICFARAGPKRHENACIDAGMVPMAINLLLENSYPSVLKQAVGGLMNLCGRENVRKPLLDVVEDLLKLWDREESVRPGLASLFDVMLRKTNDHYRTKMRNLNMHTRLIPMMRTDDPKMRPVDAASAVAWLIGHEEDHPDLRTAAATLNDMHFESDLEIAEGDWYMFELFRDCLQHALRNEVFHGIS